MNTIDNLEERHFYEFKCKLFIIASSSLWLPGIQRVIGSLDHVTIISPDNTGQHMTIEV